MDAKHCETCVCGVLPQDRPAAKFETVKGVLYQVAASEHGAFRTLKEVEQDLLMRRYDEALALVRGFLGP